MRGFCGGLLLRLVPLTASDAYLYGWHPEKRASFAKLLQAMPPFWSKDVLVRGHNIVSLSLQTSSPDTSVRPSRGNCDLRGPLWELECIDKTFFGAGLYHFWSFSTNFDNLSNSGPRSNDIIRFVLRCDSIGRWCQPSQ